MADIQLGFSIKRVDIIESRALAISSYLGSSLSSARSGISDSKVGAAVSRFALDYYGITEKVIADFYGAKKLPAITGYGFQPDIMFVREEPEFGEIKGTKILSSIQEIDGRRTIGFKTSKAIKLSSDPLSLTSGKSRQIVQGYTDQGEIDTNFKDFEGDAVTKFIVRYRGKEDKLRKDLINPKASGTTSSEVERLLYAIRDSLLRKSQFLYLPLNINSRETAVAVLQFDPIEILKRATIGGAVKPGGNNNTINISFFYPESTIQAALNTISRSPEINAVTNRFDKEFTEYLESEVTSKISDLSVRAAFDIKIDGVLNKIFSGDIGYNKGSIITYQGILNYIRTLATKKAKPSGPSLIDITLAVKDQVSGRMRSGSGKATPPMMTYRTGTFVESIRAVADVKRRTVNYFFNPRYARNEYYGYIVDQLVAGSARQVAAKEFNTRFALNRVKF